LIIASNLATTISTINSPKTRPNSISKPMNSLRHLLLRCSRKGGSEKELMGFESFTFGCEPGTAGDEDSVSDGGEEDFVLDFGDSEGLAGGLGGVEFVVQLHPELEGG
jgi:hypothetical protein